MGFLIIDDRGLVPNSGYISFNLTVLFCINSIKIAEKFPKGLKKEVTISFVWIKLADIFIQTA